MRHFKFYFVILFLLEKLSSSFALQLIATPGKRLNYGCSAVVEDDNNRIEPSIISKDIGYFVRCAAAGAVSCSFTHSALVPIDVIKTKVLNFHSPYF